MGRRKILSDKVCESYWDGKSQKEKDELERQIKLSYTLGQPLSISLDSSKEIKYLPKREITADGREKCILIQYFANQMNFSLDEPKLYRHLENVVKMNVSYANRVPGVPDIVAQIQESAEEGRSGNFLFGLSQVPYPCSQESDRLEKAFCLLDWMKREGYVFGEEIKVSRIGKKEVILEGSVKKIK